MDYSPFEEILKRQYHATDDDNITPSFLRHWSFFRDMRTKDLLDIRAFHVFYSPPFMSSSGGLSAIFITFSHKVYGVGHNNRNINILGFSNGNPLYRKESALLPTIVTGLSKKRILQLSTGALIGAALCGDGSLLWWGLCSEKANKIVTPQAPRMGKQKYLAISCGCRMMAALSESYAVFIWGQVSAHDAVFLDGECVSLGLNIRQISCGLHHLAMLDNSGHVLTWGWGGEGQLGLGYSWDLYSREYTTRKISEEPCIKVKCGPYSTLCITSSCEVKACGLNTNHTYWGIKIEPTLGLTKIPMKKPVTDLVILWSPKYTTAKVAVITNRCIIYTWGTSAIPKRSRVTSFRDVFVSWKPTPGLTLIKRNLSSRPLIGPAPPRSVTETAKVSISEVLMNSYLSKRPESSDQNSTASSSATVNSAYEITRIDIGRSFILDKFLTDMSHFNHPQRPASRTN